MSVFDRQMSAFATKTRPYLKFKRKGIQNQLYDGYALLIILLYILPHLRFSGVFGVIITCLFLNIPLQNDLVLYKMHECFSVFILHHSPFIVTCDFNNKIAMPSIYKKKHIFSSFLFQMHISRNHALCMYYQLKHSTENVQEALERFMPLSQEHEICFLNDPTIPVLVLKARMYGSPFVFKEYLGNEATGPKDTNNLKLGMISSF